MKYKKLIALLIAGLVMLCNPVSCPLTLAAGAVGNGSLTAESLSEAVYQRDDGTIVINSVFGARASDIQDTINRYSDPDYRKNGMTNIRLEGRFVINKTIDLGHGISLDASDAVIGGTAPIFFSSYGQNGIHFKGGTWNLKEGSRLLKLSKSNDIAVDSLTVIGGGSFEFGNVLLFSCGNAVIKNCSFRKTNSQVIFVHSSHDVLLLKNTIYNVNGHGIYVYGGLSDANGNLTSFRSYNISALGNNIKYACGDGIKFCRCADGCNIAGNSVKFITLNKDLDYDPLKGAARSGVGIMVMECEGMNVGADCTYGGETFGGNIVDTAENYGMHVNLSNNTLIVNNTFNKIGSDGIHNTASARTSVKNCTFTSCGDVGIFFTPGPVDSVEQDKRSSVDSVVRNNRIDKCGSFGIEISKAVNVLLANNTQVNCQDYGIYCIGARNISIRDNGTASTKTNYYGSGIGYNSASSGISIRNDYKISVTLNKTTLSLGLGEKFRMKATLGNSLSDTVTWYSSDKNVVTVSSGGYLTAKGKGTAYITARSVEGAEAVCRVNVKNAPDSISLSKTVLTLGVGEKYTLSNEISAGSASAKRTFSSSNSDVVRMTRTDWSCEFKAVKPGVSYITAKTYNGATATCKVIVKEAPKDVSVSQKSMTLRVGQSATLSGVISSDSGCATRTFTTSDRSVVNMTKTNWTAAFTAASPGTARVTFSTYNGKEASCLVTVLNN